MMMFLNLQVLRKDTSRKYKYYDNKTNKIIESSKRKASSIERKNFLLQNKCKNKTTQKNKYFPYKINNKGKL